MKGGFGIVVVPLFNLEGRTVTCAVTTVREVAVSGEKGERPQPSDVVWPHRCVHFLPAPGQGVTVFPERCHRYRTEVSACVL